VLANLSASNITVGKAEYRRQLCASQSARMIAAYLYAAAGSGESTTDLACDGQALIYENGDLLAQAERFSPQEELILADIDFDRIMADRASISSYADSIHGNIDALQRIRRIAFDLGASTALERAALRRRSRVFPTSRPTRTACTATAKRSTTFRFRASRRACARHRSRRS
jgi:NAD+ synthase (glutamine-hydrolysing)